ncbi:LOW QUALITY PROTEIN: hypothetical protein AAY473_029563 [Plecturocebus cupreus]
MVTMEIRGQQMDFMVDTGAEHSVVTQPIGPLSKNYATIIGVTTVSEKRPFCQTRRGREVQDEFLCLPNCPVPLLGRDLLQKLQAEITFRPQGNMTLDLSQPKAMVLTLTLPKAKKWSLYTDGPRCKLGILEVFWLLTKIPRVWAEDKAPGLAGNQAPVVVQLKPEVSPVWFHQYPLFIEATWGV